MVGLILLVLTFLFGVVVGTCVVASFQIVTSGGADAKVDRDDLLNILVVDFEIEPITARAIIEKGLNPWARFRKSTRPWLWRIGLDWPEYSMILKREFMLHYGRALPEYSSSTSSPDASGDNLPESGHDDSPTMSAETEIPSGSTSPNDGDS